LNSNGKMTTRNHQSDYILIAGSLEALNSYLYNFEASEDKGETSNDIYQYMKQSLFSNIESVTRYALPKAALDLFAKHCHHFEEIIYNDYQQLFDRISQWAQHKKYEMKRLAYIALDSYYKNVTYF
jgi:hypothetical protein